MIEENRTQGGFKVNHIIIVVLVVALIWVIWSNYSQEPRPPEPTTDQAAVVGQSLNDAELPSEADAAAVEAEIDVLLTQFDKSILFPVGERPQLATIENAQALAAENFFFSGSQNGDQVLIYLQTGKAYVLSPSRNLVVNVGPIVDEPSVARTAPNGAEAVETE